MLVAIAGLGIVLAMTALRLQVITQQMLANADRQIQHWQKIESWIEFKPHGLTDGEARARITERLQRKVLATLTEIETLDQQLIAQHESLAPILRGLGFIGGVKGIAVYNGVDHRLRDRLRQYTRESAELAELTPMTWDTDIQLLFLSNAYLDPLHRLTLNLRDLLEHNIFRFSVGLIALLFISMAVTYWLWTRHIGAAYLQLEDQRRFLSRANAQISESNDQLRTAFDSLRDAACLTDRDGNIILMNGQFAQIFYPGGDTDPRTTFQSSIRALSAYRPPTNEADISAVVEKLEAKPEFSFAGRDLYWRCTALVTGGWLIIAHDQTDFLAQTSQQLRLQRLDIMERLSSSMAHDFNNVLAAIMTKAEMVALDHRPMARLQADMQRIVGICARGRDLTSHLLSYARQQPLSLSRHRLDTLVRQAIASQTLPPNIVLSLKSHSSSLINVDPAYFLTMIENTILNALEAIDDAPGQITVITSDHVHPDGTCWSTVEVLDTGGGFTEEAIRYGTDPFYSTKYQKNGTGLGLAMVAGFVAQCGGTLSLINVRGGACCQMSFPAVSTPGTDVSSEGIQGAPRAAEASAPHEIAPAETSPAEISVSQGAALPKQVCLLVEDDPNVRMLMDKFLQRYFGRVLVAGDCETARQTLRSAERIDAALCDWKLPDGTSQSIIQTIRELHPGARLVIFTGLLEDNVPRLAQELGISVLNKPVSLKTLIGELKLDLA